MTGLAHEFPAAGQAQELLNAIRAWQSGETQRQTVVIALSTVPRSQGHVMLDVLSGLSRRVELARPSEAGHQQEDTESWRGELMASRARAWDYPDGAGLLVCPSVLILTDGRRGVALRESGAKALPASTSASLMLLCQTIVMAQNSVNEQEMQRLQQQRIESTSTSLSEIEIIR